MLREHLQESAGCVSDKKRMRESQRKKLWREREREGEKKKKTKGMVFRTYFPHRELAVAPVTESTIKGKGDKGSETSSSRVSDRRL